MEFRDYYQALGVAREAGADEIKRAYRKLARKYHPDVSKEKDAEKRMKEVNEAYAVLSDPEKRAAYDRLGAGHHAGEEFRPPPGWDSGFEFSEPHGGAGGGFSDFFSEIFGRMGGAEGRGAGFGGAARDHHARIQLDLEDAFTGPERQITLQAPKVDARGRVTLEQRTLNVKIPKGIREGQIIRLAGQGAGGAGNGGAKPGDLLLEVAFRPHPRLRPEGRDLHLALPVAPWEAALGAVVPVDLPGGSTIQVRIPEGAGSADSRGRRLRVRGKGLPSDPPGDLYIDIEVVAPPATSAKARAAYETLRETLQAETGFDPRRGGRRP